MSAAERAAEVLRTAWIAWLEYHSDTPEEVDAAMVAALMADPVIVDLAIEAGWLEPVAGPFVHYRRREALHCDPAAVAVPKAHQAALDKLRGDDA